MLHSINETLEEHRVGPETHLTKDQIVELVHDAISAGVVASDRRKLEAIQRGIGRSFVTDDPFEEKQLLLAVLRSLSSIELSVFYTVYERDPYRIEQDNEREINSEQAGLVVLKGGWSPVANAESDLPPLLEYLSHETGFEEPLVEGALNLLDGKGLTSASPNLRLNHTTVYRREVYDPLTSNTAFSSAGGPDSLFNQQPINPTPIERSRTLFGEKLLSFCMRW